MAAKARKEHVRRARRGGYEAIHSAAAALHRAGGIGKATMREYDALCIEPVKLLRVIEKHGLKVLA